MGLLKKNMGVCVDQNAFFQELPSLAKKKYTLAKLSPCPHKTFAGPPLPQHVGISGHIMTYDICIYMQKTMYFNVFYNILHVHFLLIRQLAYSVT